MELKIIRSSKRKKTVSARIEGDLLLIQAPAAMSDTELMPIIETLKSRLARKKQKDALDDALLQRRAAALNKAHFGGKLKWKSIRWVTNQNTRAGSCTPADGTIRLSHRLNAMPTFVLDYVIVHELAHLLEGNHSAKFWKLVGRYPKTERARGYLMAVNLEQPDEEDSQGE